MNVNLIRYTGVFVLASLAMTVLSLLLETYFGVSVSGTLVSVVATVAAAQVEGAKLAHAGHLLIGGKDSWRQAVKMAIAACSVSLILAAVVMLLDPALLGKLSALPVAFWGGIILALFVFFTILNRIFLRIGMTNALKVIEKRQQTRQE